MKKLTATLLALVLALTTLLCVPALADTTIANTDGLELRVLKCSVSDIGGETSVTLHTRVINNKSLKLWVGFDGSTIDGVDADDSGRSIEANTDTGDNDPKYYTFSCHTSVPNPKTLQTTLIVQDYDNYDELFRQELTIDLTSLPVGDAPVETPKPTTPPSSYDDSNDYSNDYSYDDDGNYAPPYTPKSTNYQTLQKGSKGQAVRDLQQRLVDLGYLCDKVDGSYGRNTNTAVRAFCEQNGLPIASQATPEMQEKLFSGYARYHTMPYIPLMIAGDYKITPPWETGTNNVGSIQVELVNRSSDRGIRGYVLSFYQTDMYGNKIDLHPEGNGVYYADREVIHYLEPGHYQSVEECYPFALPQKYGGTYAVYVGVMKVVLDDGEVRELGHDDITYFECRVDH